MTLLRAEPAALRRHPALGAVLLAVATGGFLAILAVAYQLRTSSSTELGIAGVGLALCCVIVGNPRRCMLAAIVVDIPLEWGKYLFWNQAQGSVGAVAGLNISVTTIALIGLYVMWAFDRRDSARPLRLRAALPLILYVAVNLLSVLAAQDKTLALYYVVLLGQTLLMFIYIASAVRTRADVQFMVTVLMAGLLIESLLILLIYGTGSNLSLLGLKNRVDPSLYGGRVGGTVGSPNDAGAYLCLMLSLAIGVLASRPPKLLRRLAAGAFGLGMLALIVSGSRGGWVGFAVASALMGIWMIRQRIILARSAAVVVLVIVILSAPLWGTVTQRVTGNDNGSASSRIGLMKLAGKMISAHPLLGLGTNNVGIEIPQYAGPEFDGQFLYTIHNKYLLVWAEAGIGALLAFVWFLIATLRRGWRAARAGDRMLSPIAAGLGAGIAGQMLHMGVDIFQSKPEVQGLWLVAALLTAIELILRRERREGRARSSGSPAHDERAQSPHAQGRELATCA